MTLKFSLMSPMNNDKEHFNETYICAKQEVCILLLTKNMETMRFWLKQSLYTFWLQQSFYWIGAPHTSPLPTLPPISLIISDDLWAILITDDWPNNQSVVLQGGRWQRTEMRHFTFIILIKKMYTSFSQYINTMDIIIIV